MMGSDVRSVDDAALAILSNEALIAVNQDLLGVQARSVGSHRNIDIWVKPMSDGSVAVGFFHLGERAGARCRLRSLHRRLDDGDRYDPPARDLRRQRCERPALRVYAEKIDPVRLLVGDREERPVGRERD